LPDHLPGLLDLHLQEFQFGCVVFAPLCHGITVAVAVPCMSVAASLERITMAFDKLFCSLWQRKVQSWGEKSKA
jgi:hypothetical protein